MRVRLAGSAALLALGVALFGAGPAGAEFGPIRLVSRNASLQADEAVAPAISADGRYVAFQGAIAGERGVFRKDLATGAVTPVAAGSIYEAGSPGSDATAPSISADGRHVAFTTATPLDPLDDSQAASRDVYVADMSASPPTYELASALDGGSAGLTYGGAGGSEASGRVALSADGRKVAFFTTATSNLTGEPGKTETPAGQVALRDLDSERTTLVSAERDPETEAMTGRPVAGGALINVLNHLVLGGAAVSADGSTVCWLGAHLPAQVPLSPAEAQGFAALDEKGGRPYDEPLWRRTADGPAAPTLRVVAGDGPGDPFPNLTNKAEFNEAQGWLGAKAVDGVPQLSADGRVVALLGNPTEAVNLFLVDMTPGLSRKQAVDQLTREVPIPAAEGPAGINSLKNVPLDGHLFDLGISADGRRIAFATARQRFPLAPPNLIGSPPSLLGLVELYVADLDDESVQRVTHGLAGLGEPSLGPSSGTALTPVNGAGASAPSFGGGLISFGSTASNLVAGDGNDAGDAFTVEDREAMRIAAASSISAAPGKRRRRVGWRLKLSAFSLPDGTVRLVAMVPARGGLHAGVSAELGASPGPRHLDVARARARRSGPIALELRLPPRLRHLAHSREGVYATAGVSFHSRGRPVLRGRVQVRFHAHRMKKGGKR